MNNTTTQLNIRVPLDIKSFLTDEAKKDGRSLNNYLLQLFSTIKDKSDKTKSQF